MQAEHLRAVLVGYPLQGVGALLEGGAVGGQSVSGVELEGGVQQPLAEPLARVRQQQTLVVVVGHPPPVLDLRQHEADGAPARALRKGKGNWIGKKAMVQDLSQEECLVILNLV